MNMIQAFWKKVFWIAVGAVILLLLITWIGVNECDAQSAVVLFNDAEHLAAISDSIVGVCDTTIEILEMIDADSFDIDSCMGTGRWLFFYRFYFQSDIFYKRCPAPRLCWSTRERITCRRLVGVTVVEESGICDWNVYHAKGYLYVHTESTMLPGKAIIFYEKRRK